MIETINGTRHGQPLRWLRGAVRAADTDECIEWPFGTSRGYGQVIFRGEKRQAHAVALLLAGIDRPAPPDHLALHSCDNRRCVNLAHLRWGSLLDNAADRWERGPGDVARGERVGTAKLTEDEVRAIRRAPTGPAETARRFGITPQTVWLIRTGQRWEHVR